MEQVKHNSLESNAIRQRMEEVRCDLDEDVQEIVEGARDMREWRTYVKSYPWVCLGAAVAVGYLLVPRRPLGIRLDAPTLAELAKQSRSLAEARTPPKGGVGGTLLKFVGSQLVRGVASYVGQQAGKHFAQQATESQRATELQQED